MVLVDMQQVLFFASFKKKKKKENEWFEREAIWPTKHKQVIRAAIGLRCYRTDEDLVLMASSLRSLDFRCATANNRCGFRVAFSLHSGFWIVRDSQPHSSECLIDMQKQDYHSNRWSSSSKTALIPHQILAGICVAASSSSSVLLHAFDVAQTLLSLNLIPPMSTDRRSWFLSLCYRVYKDVRTGNFPTLPSPPVEPVRRRRMPGLALPYPSSPSSSSSSSTTVIIPQEYRFPFPIENNSESVLTLLPSRHTSDIILEYALCKAIDDLGDESVCFQNSFTLELDAPPVFDMQKHRLVLMPVHQASARHWVLYTLYPQCRLALLFDSIRQRSMACVKELRGYLSKHTGASWKIQRANTPLQPNTYDCGFYVCVIGRELLTMTTNPSIPNRVLRGGQVVPLFSAEQLKDIEEKVTRERQRIWEELFESCWIVDDDDDDGEGEEDTIVILPPKRQRKD